MEILTALSATIDRLKADPAAVDIAEIIQQLSAAYNVANQGLHRSDAASRLPAALKRIDDLTTEIQTLTPQLDQLQQDRKQLQALQPVVQYLRDRLSALLKLHNPQTFNLQSNAPETADPRELIDMLSRVEHEIQSSWITKPKPLHGIQVAIDRYPKQNPNLYSTGASHGTRSRS